MKRLDDTEMLDLQDLDKDELIDLVTDLRVDLMNKDVTMQVWAHRGTNVGVEENTLEAFRKALHYNPYGLELDVRLCGSGEVIVFHDPTLWRTARSFEVVESISLKRIRKLLPYYVPTLSEFIEEFANKSKLCIDVKGSKFNDVALESSIVKALEQVDTSKYEFSSKSLLSLAKLYKLSKVEPEITLVLSNPKKLNWGHRILHIDNLSINDKFITKAPRSYNIWSNPIKKLKAKGYNVRVYTVNSPIRAQSLALMGADGIFTDDIASMLSKATLSQN